MSPGVWTLEADEPIAAAVEMMLNRNVTAVPVVEGRRAGARMIGMVHLRDVLSSLIFVSSVSHDRHAHAGRHARYGARVESRHASSRHSNDHAHSQEPQAGRAS